MAQLELFVELQTAKMPQAVIAARLGVDQATFKAARGGAASGRRPADLSVRHVSCLTH
jgi:hypothetical protein